MIEPTVDFSKKDFGSYEMYQDKLSYYQWARGKAADGFFHSWKDRLIWEGHSEGVSERKIANTIGYDQSWISRRIDKIKTYLLTDSISSMSATCQLNFF